MNDPSLDERGLILPLLCSIPQVGIDRFLDVCEDPEITPVVESYWLEVCVAYSLFGQGAERILPTLFCEKLIGSDVLHTDWWKNGWQPLPRDVYYQLSRFALVKHTELDERLGLELNTTELRRDICYYLAKGDFVCSYRAASVLGHISRKNEDMGSLDADIERYLCDQVALISDIALAWEKIIFSAIWSN